MRITINPDAEIITEFFCIPPERASKLIKHFALTIAYTMQQDESPSVTEVGAIAASKCENANEVFMTGYKVATFKEDKFGQAMCIQIALEADEPFYPEQGLVVNGKHNADNMADSLGVDSERFGYIIQAIGQRIEQIADSKGAENVEPARTVVRNAVFEAVTPIDLSTYNEVWMLGYYFGQKMGDMDLL